MQIEEETIKLTLKLYDSLKVSNEDLEKIGELLSNSPSFKKISNLDDLSNIEFIKKILSEKEFYINPLFFIMAASELNKWQFTSNLMSKIVVNSELLDFPGNCKHKEDEIIYRRKFANKIPIHGETEITFCKNCFIEYYEEKIRQNLPSIEPNDKLGIGVSGEKDSTAALKAICELKRKNKIKIPEITVCFIDEGIHGVEGDIQYRETCEIFVRKICEEYGLNLKIYRYKEIFGFNIDDLYTIGYNPCRMDSQLMDIVSRIFIHENKITCSFGNLTEDESFQLGLLGLEGLKFNMPPVRPNKMSKLKINGHKSKSFNIAYNLRDEENRIYLACTNTEYNSKIKCPYGEYNVGKSYSSLIKEMENTHPGAISSFNDALDNLVGKITQKERIGKNRVKFCPKCKLPSISSYRKSCLNCQLKQELEEFHGK